MIDVARTRLLVAILCLGAASLPLLGQIRQLSDDDYTALRHQMVERQIRSRGVSQPGVLEAMAKVPRHLLVPMQHRRAAYEDHPLSIGYDQTISQPYIVAVMTEVLDLSGDERVLEIGTGSGYQAAVLAELAAEVFSIEIVEPLASRAAADLARLGYDVEVRAGDGYEGWPSEAPFDAIILTAAPLRIPQPLLDQLALGGRLVAPVGDYSQELVLITRDEDGLDRETLIAVRFVPMTGEAQRQR